jgi:hypothetical protein
MGGNRLSMTVIMDFFFIILLFIYIDTTSVYSDYYTINFVVPTMMIGMRIWKSTSVQVSELICIIFADKHYPDLMVIHNVYK